MKRSIKLFLMALSAFSVIQLLLIIELGSLAFQFYMNVAIALFGICGLLAVPASLLLLISNGKFVGITNPKIFGIGSKIFLLSLLFLSFAGITLALLILTSKLFPNIYV